MSDEAIRIGVIGGSGLYNMEGLRVIEEVQIQTPFGPTSDAIIIGEMETEAGPRKVAFLPRHGRGHRHNPTQIPVRANIWALKKLGVFWLTSVSAVGSLKREIEPCHFVVPDQVIDRTRSRVNTFFDDIAVHCGFSYPFHNDLRAILLSAARDEGLSVHDGGTYVCMEGPLFSTIAESNMHRSWGASIIGMTALPEAKLAREAELCYALLAMGTDYDCWHETEEDVSVEAVLGILKANAALANATVAEVARLLPATSDCECLSAARYAIITAREAITAPVKERLRVLYGKYF